MRRTNFNLGLLSIQAVILAILAQIRRVCGQILSSILNVFLSWRHATFKVDGKTSIPSCDYEWPNGQGDAAKFLYGASNSEKWGKKLGSIYRIWSGFTPEIVLTKPEDIKNVFKDSNKHSKATANDSGYLMHQLLGSCLGLIGGSPWEAVRETFKGPFLPTQATTFAPLIQSEVKKFFDALMHDRKLESGVIDPAKDLSMLPFLIIAKIIYGELEEAQHKELKELIKIREALFRQVMSGGLSRFYWSKYLPTKTNASLIEFKYRWKTFNDKVISKLLDMGKYTPIVQMSRFIESGKVTGEQFYQTLDEILFANLDVTTGGTSWVLTLLATYEEYQSKVRTELYRKEDSNMLEEYITKSFTLLDACILESARLKPAAAFTVPQSAPTIRIVDGFIIPANTNVIVDTYALNIRNEFWGEDSRTYRPERFLEKAASEYRYHYWRFGFGPRQCLGKYIADLIIRATISYIIINYDLECPMEEDGPGRNHEVWIDHPVTLLRCTMRDRSRKK
ncbi:putative cytochrome P450 monooxygenase [Lojkania enalia]|uniref:Cytochrome P450 monooxygenase n=1 Tax=Lojkania enalia TaxID=147567 RepID=A0A9P4K1M5_9PLEO|nr:putative cytochrome P450 monooxygenase [Didymosphaeria enalia]